MGFPGGSEGKASACNAGDSGSIPGLGFPGGTSGKEPACQCRRHKRCGFDPLVKKIPWRRAWQPTPVFLSGKSHGQRSPVGYSPLGHKVKWLSTHTHHFQKERHISQREAATSLEGAFPTKGASSGRLSQITHQRVRSESKVGKEGLGWEEWVGSPAS